LNYKGSYNRASTTKFIQRDQEEVIDTKAIVQLVHYHSLNFLDKFTSRYRGQSPELSSYSKYACLPPYQSPRHTFHHHTMSSSRNRRIAKEVADIHSDSLSNISVNPAGNGDELTHLKGSFKGPPGTPYEGGNYTVDVKIPSDYPFRPPVMKFDTKLWHPNVSSQTVSQTFSFQVLESKLTNFL